MIVFVCFCGAKLNGYDDHEQHRSLEAIRTADRTKEQPPETRVREVTKVLREHGIMRLEA